MRGYNGAAMEPPLFDRAPSRRSDAFARPLVLVLILVLIQAAVALPAAAARRENGERVQVSGVVTDAQGRPLSDVQVVLEASRAFFNLRRFAKDETGTRRLAATTNGRGEFTLEWIWDDYFNKFALGVAVPVQTPGGEDLHFLHRSDLTRRFEQGGPVVAALNVRDTSFLTSLRTFLESVDSDDERRVYEARGYPDRVKEVRHAEHSETAWWYFESGKVYRFRDGRLTETGDFDPVEGF